jgi:predicted nucleic acid-binding protein
VILLDTSGLLAAIDESQRAHRDCVSALQASAGPLLLSPFVLAELDYLLGRHVGASAQAALLEDVARGAYQLERFDANDVARAAQVIERFADLQIGIADASLVVLAERHGVSRILTLDVKHFSVLRIGERKRFTLVPAAR